MGGASAGKLFDEMNEVVVDPLDHNRRDRRPGHSTAPAAGIPAGAADLPPPITAEKAGHADANEKVVSDNVRLQPFWVCISRNPK